MKKYSIKFLEGVTGIHAHTIRAWEQRYNLFCPERTETNIREYSEEDLKRLMNIAILINNGCKISKIALMGPEELHQTVLSLEKPQSEVEVQIAECIQASIHFDEQRLENIMARLILQYDFEQAMTRFILPFFDKMDLLMQTEVIKPTQEQFAANLIKQHIFVAIDAQVQREDSNRKKIALFLPEGEFRVMRLMFIKYLIRKHGGEPIFLGKSIPKELLPGFMKMCPVDYFLMTVSASYVQNPISYAEYLKEHIPEIKLIVISKPSRLDHLSFPDNTICLPSLQGLTEFLQEIRPKTDTLPGEKV